MSEFQSLFAEKSVNHNGAERRKKLCRPAPDRSGALFRASPQYEIEEFALATVEDFHFDPQHQNPRAQFSR